MSKSWKGFYYQFLGSGCSIEEIGRGDFGFGKKFFE